MIDVASRDELGIGVGDELEVVTEIRRNDIVIFERTDPGSFAMMALDKKAAESYEGRNYVIDTGRMPGTVKLTLE